MAMINMKKIAKENLIILCLITLTVVSGFASRIPLAQIAIYIVVQIFVIYLLGKTIIDFCGFSFRTKENYFFSAYALGYAFNLLLYLAMLLIGKPQISIYFAYILAIVNAVFLIAKRRKKTAIKEFEHHTDKSKIIAAVSFTFAWLIMFICFQAAKLSAEITGYSSMPADDQFWFKEAVEGTRGIPMPDFSAMGVVRCYHYFSGTWCAFLHYLTGIEIYDVCFSLSWVGDIFLLVGGIFVLFFESKNIGIIGLIAALSSLLLTSSMQTSTLTYYINHLYVTHFGYLPGAAMGIYTFALFIKWFNDEKHEMRQLLCCIMVFFITLGMKAPCGVIVIAGIGIMCVFILLTGKNKKEKTRGLLAGLLFSTVFLITYKTLFTYPDDLSIYSGATAIERTSLTNTLFRSGYFEYLKDALVGVFESKYVGYAFTFILFWLMSNFVMAVFLLVALYICVKNRIHLEAQDIGTVAMVLTGYILYTFTWQKGYSQVYFMFAIFPYGMFLALNIIGKRYNIEGMKNTKYWQLLVAFLGIIILGGIYKSYQYYVPNCVKPGGYNLFATYDSDTEYPGSTGNDVNYQELEALRWLRDNSDEDAVIITNLAMINRTSFTTCCFTERQTYIEGEDYGAANQEFKDYRYELVGRYYSGDSDAAHTLAEEGVDYAVVFASVPNYSNYIGNVIYENDAVKIVAFQ